MLQLIIWVGGGLCTVAQTLPICHIIFLNLSLILEKVGHWQLGLQISL